MDKEKIVTVKYLIGEEAPFVCDEKLEKGERVVVLVDGSTFIGSVSGEFKGKLEDKPGKILRKATNKDEEKNKENEKQAKSAIAQAKDMARQFGLDMKISSAQYSLDKNKLVFNFVSENRVDFRDFVKQLASVFKARIELKQIGSRDEVKCCGGIGVCGKVCCCNEFLPDFAKVSIKMAKNQNLSLNPQKINGLCGRLMCCLAFENEDYAKIMAKMPKLGSEVETKDGKGTATYNDVINEKVSVKFTNSDGGFEIKDFPIKDVKVKTYAIKE